MASSHQEGNATARKTAWRSRIVGEAAVAPDQLTPHPENWRRHPQAQQRALAGALGEIGWIQRVIVSKRTGRILDGHARVELATARGEASVPVVYVDLDENEERLALASIDPLGALAETDQAQLDALLAEVSAKDEGLLALLDGLRSPAPAVGLTDPDDVPPAPVEPVTQPGDMWLLGEHRLLCGDSTKAEDYDRLLGDAVIDLVLTDPPYGVGIDYASFDDTTSGVASLVLRFLPLVRRWPVVLLTPGIPAMWDYPRPDWLLAWVHPAASGSCPWGFASLNPILAYGRDPYLARGKGRRDSTLVSASDRKGDDSDHPVAKPMAVWEWLLERGSPKTDESVLDPFLGSGTTLIACERLGRRCYAMEIEPKYVDVAVRRWEAFTGREAQRAG